MNNRNNALLLFSKFPRPGKVKTRLTTLKDGVFSPEDAAELYEAMLLDVVDVCMAAFARLEKAAAARRGDSPLCSIDSLDLEPGADATGVPSDTYELVISVAPAEDIEPMRTLIAEECTTPFTVTFITDAGTSFDEHYNDAFAQVWQRGADCILSMGADMPALTVDDVVRGFEALHELDANDAGGIVLAPDQEMGVSIIGWTKSTAFDHNGVFYNPTGLTVLPAYIAKARDARIDAIYLPPVPDVDTMADLMHNVTLVEALGYCAVCGRGMAPMHTMAKLEDLGIDEVRIMPNALMDPREAIDALDA